MLTAHESNKSDVDMLHPLAVPYASYMIGILGLFVGVCKLS